MAIIYKTNNFILESHEKPEIDRLEGGHLKISPKITVKDRSELTSKQAIELMRFTIISGEAMKLAMKKIGVNIGRINYQENGNWTPHLHVHLYCRAKNATMQKYGDPIVPGHKDKYNSLNKEDIKRIKQEIDKLFKLKKFSDSTWRIS
jgi:diadenosine tetraphosphate (Ap4A) HIT family hydrolase